MHSKLPFYTIYICVKRNLSFSNTKTNPSTFLLYLFIFRQYWMPDDITVECYDCTSKVSMLRMTNNNTKLNLYLQLIT